MRGFTQIFIVLVSIIVVSIITYFYGKSFFADWNTDITPPHIQIVGNCTYTSGGAIVAYSSLASTADFTFTPSPAQCYGTTGAVSVGITISCPNNDCQEIYFVKYDSGGSAPAKPWAFPAWTSPHISPISPFQGDSGNSFSATLIVSSTSSKTVEAYGKDAAGNIGFVAKITFAYTTSSIITPPPPTLTPTGVPPTPTPNIVACPGGTNACGDNNYRGLGLCNGTWTPKNNSAMNQWCTINANPSALFAFSRDYCYECIPYPTTPPPQATPTSPPIPNSTTGLIEYNGIFWGRMIIDRDENKLFGSGTGTSLVGAGDDTTRQSEVSSVSSGFPYITYSSTVDSQNRTYNGGVPTDTTFLGFNKINLFSRGGGPLAAGKRYNYDRFTNDSNWTTTVRLGGSSVAVSTTSYADAPSYPTQTCPINRSDPNTGNHDIYCISSSLLPTVPGVEMLSESWDWRERSSFRTTSKTSYRMIPKPARATYDLIQQPNVSGGISFFPSQGSDEWGDSSCKCMRAIDGGSCNLSSGYVWGGGGCPAALCSGGGFGWYSPTTNYSQCQQAGGSRSCVGSINPLVCTITGTGIIYTNAAGPGPYDGWTLLPGVENQYSNDHAHRYYTAYGFKINPGYSPASITWSGLTVSDAPPSGHLDTIFDTSVEQNKCGNNPYCECNETLSGTPDEGLGWSCDYPLKPAYANKNFVNPGDYYFTVDISTSTPGINVDNIPFTFTVNIGGVSRTVNPSGGRINQYFTVPASAIGSSLSISLSYNYLNPADGKPFPVHIGTAELNPLGLYVGDVYFGFQANANFTNSYCFQNVSVNNPPLLYNKILGTYTSQPCPGNVSINYRPGQTPQFNVWPVYVIQNDVLVGRPNTIKGNIYLDKDKDGIKDAGEANYTGSYIIRAYSTATGTMYEYSCTSSCDGTYTLYVDPGGYRVEYVNLPTEYYPTYPNGTPIQHINIAVDNPPGCNRGTGGMDGIGIDHGASCDAKDNVNNLNFGITDKISWIQGIGGDIRLDTGITIPVPLSSPLSIFASTIGTGGTPGVLFSGDVLYNFCRGGAQGCIDRSSSKKWLVGLPPAPPNDYSEVFNTRNLKELRTSYNTYVAVAKQNGIVLTDITTLSGCGSLTNCSLSGITNGVYKANGNVTLTNSSFTFPTSKHIVILVNGNLTIQNNLIVPKGSTVTFSVSGNIYITPTVGVSTANTLCTPTTTLNGVSSGCNIEGFYSADGIVEIQTNGTPGTPSTFCNPDGSPKDKKLTIHGTLIINAARATACNPASQCFVQLRDLCEENANPTVQIQERPDFLIYAPEFLKRRNLIYQEVAP